MSLYVMYSGNSKWVFVATRPSIHKTTTIPSSEISFCPSQKWLYEFFFFCKNFEFRKKSKLDFLFEENSAWNKYQNKLEIIKYIDKGRIIYRRNISYIPLKVHTKTDI